MGSTRIAARPASAMKIESTAAKIGRSMKKRENIVYSLDVGAIVGTDARRRSTPEADFLGAASLAGVPPFAGAPGAPGGGAFGSPTCTVAPGKTFIRPSVITLSPAFTPEVTTQSPPTHSPTVIGAGTALFSGPSR